MVVIEVISGIIVTGMVVATIIIGIKLNKTVEKIEVSPNLPIGENPCRTQFTNGYYQLLITKQLLRKNGCVLIEGYPLDVEQGEKVKKPELQSFVVRSEFIKRFARGELSSNREVIKFIGRSSADYPEGMRETPEGKWETEQGQLAYLKKVFGKGIQAGDDAIANAMSEFARGQISKNVLQQIIEENKKLREIKTLQQESEEKK